MPSSPAYEKYPQHTLTIDPERVSVRVSVGETLVAQSTRALNLREGRYPAVVYIPRDDCEMGPLTRSDHSTHCPFKGDASYFDFAGGGVEQVGVEQVAWSYEAPFDEMAAIRDHLAFYPDRARIEIVERER